MKIKKRAKSVTFGKPKEKDVEQPSSPETIEVSESVTKISVTTIPEEENGRAEDQEQTPPQEKQTAIEDETTDSTEASEPTEEDSEAQVPQEEITVTVQEEPEEETSTPKSEQTKEESVSEKPHSAFSFTDEEEFPPVKKKKSIFFFFLISFVAFLLGLGGIIGFSYLSDEKGITLPAVFQKPTETPTPEPSKTPTPKPVDLSSYTIRVLNGSGVTGEAGKLQKALDAVGFKVGDTGNADNSSYTKTIISANDKVDKSYLEKLRETLSKTYMVDEQIKTIPAAGGADVVVTIGSETAK
jgi:hypothetical protein